MSICLTIWKNNLISQRFLNFWVNMKKYLWYSRAPRVVRDSVEILPDTACAFHTFLESLHEAPAKQ